MSCIADGDPTFTLLTNGIGVFLVLKLRQVAPFRRMPQFRYSLVAFVLGFALSYLIGQKMCVPSMTSSDRLVLSLTSGALMVFVDAMMAWGRKWENNRKR